MSEKVTFTAEPGTVLSFVAGPDARVCEYTFNDSGVLELDAEDQEPVTIIRNDFVGSDSQPVSEGAPQKKAPPVSDFASRKDRQ